MLEIAEAGLEIEVGFVHLKGTQARHKPLGELRQKWRTLYKAEASPHLSRELLLRAVAYRMQEVALGGLRPERQPFLRASQNPSFPKTRLTASSDTSARPPSGK